MYSRQQRHPTTLDDDDDDDPPSTTTMLNGKGAYVHIMRHTMRTPAGDREAYNITESVCRSMCAFSFSRTHSPRHDDGHTPFMFILYERAIIHTVPRANPILYYSIYIICIYTYDDYAHTSTGRIYIETNWIDIWCDHHTLYAPLDCVRVRLIDWGSLSRSLSLCVLSSRKGANIYTLENAKCQHVKRQICAECDMAFSAHVLCARRLPPAPPKAHSRAAGWVVWKIRGKPENTFRSEAFSFRRRFQNT